MPGTQFESSQVHHALSRTGNFPLCAKRPRTGGLCRRCSGLCRDQFRRGGDFGRVVSGLEIRLPGNGDRVRQRRGSNERRLRVEAKHQVLARPFGRHIAQPDNSHSVWKPSLDGCLDEVGREEGERDRHVDLPRSASFAVCDAFGICGRFGHELIEANGAPAQSTRPGVRGSRNE